MARRLLNREDLAAKRFEANQIFTPSAPIAVAELFAGRQEQAAKIVDAVGERGRHVVLYGERGVGKSSMAQIIPFFIPRGPRTIRHIRVQAFPGDTFSIVARRIFSQIHFDEDYGQGPKSYNVAEFYPGEVTIDDFLNEMKMFKESDIPIVVIDEFNEIDDASTSVIIANVIKALSDSGANVTMLIVGVADNVNQLISKHESIERCSEQIHMPRMAVGERKEVLEERLRQLGMSMTGDGKWKIINLSKGLPAYVHALGKFAVYSALDSYRLNVVEADVDAAISAVLTSSQQTLKDAYDLATRSNQARALFRHVLTACALAKVDDAGYFTPAAVREPLSSILKRQVEIANFQDTLKIFAEKRGEILERTGESRSYRFRFGNPAMQPYVIMRGIKDGIVDDDARRVLSSPEQPDLFSTV
jgi:energy-coupling factor transporter ATP-binding protein EcfA2